MAATHELSKQVAGKTIRLSWRDGPTKGMTHEHVFHPDGTVEWHAAGEKKAPADAGKQGADGATAERAPYAAMRVSDDVCLVSYLAKSGYALTVALNFRDSQVAGVASNEKTWFPIHGSLEVVK